MLHRSWLNTVWDELRRQGFLEYDMESQSYLHDLLLFSLYNRPRPGDDTPHWGRLQLAIAELQEQMHHQPAWLETDLAYLATVLRFQRTRSDINTTFWHARPHLSGLRRYHPWYALQHIAIRQPNCAYSYTRIIAQLLIELVNYATAHDSGGPYA